MAASVNRSDRTLFLALALAALSLATLVLPGKSAHGRRAHHPAAGPRMAAGPGLAAGPRLAAAPDGHGGSGRPLLPHVVQLAQK